MTTKATGGLLGRIDKRYLAPILVTLVLIIGLFDLLGIVQAALTDPAWLGFSLEGYLFAGFGFWLFCFAMSRYSMRLERRLGGGRAR